MATHFKSWWIVILINYLLLNYYLVSTQDFLKMCNVTDVNTRLTKIVCSNITLNNTIGDIKRYYRLRKNVDVTIKDSHINLLNDSVLYSGLTNNRYRNEFEFKNNIIDNFEIGIETANLKLENNIISRLTGVTLGERFLLFYSRLHVNLNNNVIKDMSPELFSELSEWLASISMMNCSLTKIPMGVLTINQMILVGLSDNHFTTIPTGAFVDIESKRQAREFLYVFGRTIILLDNCGIETIEEGAFQGLHIKQLNVSNNNIKILSKNIFVDCNLKYIDLTNNQIESINPSTFSDLGTSLITVLLKNNKISVLPARMFEWNTGLTHLDLTDNPITTIEPYAFEGLKNIKFDFFILGERLGLLLPNIQMKQISSNTFNGLDSVQELDLSNHSVQIVFPEAFQGLHLVKYLNLSYNNIERITPETFLGLDSIKYVDLSNNHIYVLSANSFLGLDKTIRFLTIDLSYNRIETLPVGIFDSTPLLSELKLDHNNISNLDKGTFSWLKYMFQLDLSYNALSDLFKEVLYPMTSLKSLNIDSNNITQMDIKDILDHLRNFKQINLNNNPWTCSFLKNMVRDLLDNAIDFLSTATEHYTVSNVHGIACMDIEDIPHDNNTDENNADDVSTQLKNFLDGQDELIKEQIYQNTLMIIMNWILACGFILVAVLYINYNRHCLFNLSSKQSLSRRSDHGSQVELRLIR